MSNCFDLRTCRSIMFAALLVLSSIVCLAEDGSAGWLRYAPINDQMIAFPTNIYVEGNTPVERSAALELERGLSSILGRKFHTVYGANLGQAEIAGGIFLKLGSQQGTTDSYTIRSSMSGRWISITGNTLQAELYGAFHLLEEIASERPIPNEDTQTASVPIRWSDEWDNLDGTIKRGYAGSSFFFQNGHVRQDLSRASAYARLLSSVGINGCNVNNVNADPDVLASAHIVELGRLAAAFRPWGVKLALSVDLAAPQTVGGLSTFDPLDPMVVAWWKNKVNEIYSVIPDFGGFTVKADSEGRAGPSQYGRSPADAANLLARALASHHGIVLYRGFVYNNHLDWRDPKSDRARAGVDNFASLDGQFESNVILQIKEGPIDFQTREPVNPLFARLRHTNLAIEVQTSQEYTGQQRHMVWLPSMWKWALETNLHIEGRDTPLKQVIEGRTFLTESGKARLGGFISVTNAGSELNWMHHPMAMANIYGFGKLAWNPDEPLEKIIDTWTRLTWGNDPAVDQTVNRMQLDSWRVYEGYTGPNGMGTLTDILGYHFGPGIESAERNGWGQWFRGDANGIGMDRTSAGTGFAQQYPSALAAIYNSTETCPDDLLLFFHHVPYRYKLHNGKTLIQSIYDTHYESALAAGEYVPKWMTLKNRVDTERFQQVLGLFTFQAGHAIVWRDAINDWFQQISNIPDEQGRVAHHPGRFEAEELSAVGYQPVVVEPWETASGGKGVVCRQPLGCSLSLTWTQRSGKYDIAVQYFDIWRGISHYRLNVGTKTVAEWQANGTLPPAQFDPHMDGQTSTRFTAYNVQILSGDKLILTGIPDLRNELNSSGTTEKPSPGAVDKRTREHNDYREFAPVDYIQIGPAGMLTPQD
jgi:alpha-glucuronidase